MGPGSGGRGRIASVRVESPAGARLATALLAGSPRVALASPGLCRADARGWERRGGEEALGRTLREAASREGFEGAGVGIADVAVASDAAALLARTTAAPSAGEGVIVVPPGGSRAFLAGLPLSCLPFPGELREAFSALGLRRIGEVAARPREELEARFGPPGLRAHRLACGEDERVFRLRAPGTPLERSVELEGAVGTLEPLLFVLRRLLDRLCGDLAEEGWCAARLTLRMPGETEVGGGARATEAHVRPARPTRRPDLLFDLCRAALERAVSGGGELDFPVTGLSVVASEKAPAAVRQSDLFSSDWRDPAAAAAALSRIQARLGEEAIAIPATRSSHRPEGRSGWEPVRCEDATPAGDGARRARAPVPPGRVPDAPAGRDEEEAIRPVLRLLPEPEPVEVETAGGRPSRLCLDGVEYRLIAAEGPERLSGDWWRDPYRREYYRACTESGGLYWLFREYPPSGELRWWLHGWWD